MVMGYSGKWDGKRRAGGEGEGRGGAREDVG